MNLCTPLSKPTARRLMFAVSLTLCFLPVHVSGSSGPVQVYGLAARTSANVVQNTTGNAFALQVGLAPRLRLRDVPMGLKLLLEYGALRDTQRHVFSAPSAQLLIDGQVAQHLELAIGAGAQFWAAPSGPVTRPVVTLEAHYLPTHKVWRVLRSAFVASSIGASSAAGLQVRAGLEFDFHKEPLKTSPAPMEATAAAPKSHCEPVLCPPCPIPKEVAPAPGRTSQALGQPITFAFNVSDLDAKAQAYLHSLAKALTAPGATYDSLAIVGHASARGTDAHNLTVSLRRAHNVAKALISRGVPEQKLTVHGVGENEPIPGFGPNERAQQCVVLHLVGGAPSGPIIDLLTLPGAQP